MVQHHQTRDVRPVDRIELIIPRNIFFIFNQYIIFIHLGKISPTVSDVYSEL